MLLSFQLRMSEGEHNKCNWDVPNDVAQFLWVVVIRDDVVIN